MTFDSQHLFELLIKQLLEWLLNSEIGFGIFNSLLSQLLDSFLPVYIFVTWFVPLSNHPKECLEYIV